MASSSNWYNNELISTSNSSFASDEQQHELSTTLLRMDKTAEDEPSASPNAVLEPQHPETRAQHQDNSQVAASTTAKPGLPEVRPAAQQQLTAASTYEGQTGIAAASCALPSNGTSISVTTLAPLANTAATPLIATPSEACTVEHINVSQTETEDETEDEIKDEDGVEDAKQVHNEQTDKAAVPPDSACPHDSNSGKRKLSFSSVRTPDGKARPATCPYPSLRPLGAVQPSEDAPAAILAAYAGQPVALEGSGSSCADDNDSSRAAAHSSACCDHFDNTPLHWAAFAGHEALVNDMLASKMDVNAKNNRQATALHAAASAGHVGVIKALVAAGAAIEDRDQDGNLPLHCAVYSRDGEVVKLLIEADADLEYLEYMNNKSETAYVLAVNLGAVEPIRTLKAKASRLYRIHYAARHGHAKVLNELLAASAQEDWEGWEDEQGSTPLIKAAQFGHGECVQLLLDAKPKLAGDSTADKKALLIILAAQSGSADAVQYLIDDGAGVEDRDSHAQTPLMVAAARGHSAVIRVLLSNSADKDAKDSNGNTALHLAAINNHADAASALLEGKATIDVLNLKGETALRISLDKGHKAVERVLLGKGASRDFRLHWAAYNGQIDVVRSMVIAQDVKNLQTHFGDTALQCAAGQGHQDVVNFLLLEAHAQVDLPNSIGETPLILAAAKGNTDIVRSLLANGADMFCKTATGCTALHVCSSYGHPETVEVLLQACAQLPQAPAQLSIQRLEATSKQEASCEIVSGSTATGGMTTSLTKATASAGKGNERNETVLLTADNKRQSPPDLLGLVNAQDKKGVTALMLACKVGNVDAVSQLLRAGADIHTTSEDGMLAMHYAAEKGHVQVARALIAEGMPLHLGNGDGNTALHLAAENGHLKTCEYLLSAETKVDAVNKQDETPLMLAAGKGHTKVIQLLLRYGAAVNKKADDGRTPLLYAADKANEFANPLDTFNVLFEAKTDVNLADNIGDTALTLACTTGRVEVVKALIDKGADVRAVDKDGFTPLYYAVVYNSIDIVTALLKEKAPLQICCGSSVLATAAGSGFTDICKLILDAIENAQELLNTGDWEGDTPLGEAATENQVDTVELLLEYKGNPMHANRHGFVPAHIAASKGALQSLQVLLGRGTDKLVSTHSGRSLIHVAAGFGKGSVVNYLLEEIGLDANQACTLPGKGKPVVTTWQTCGEGLQVDGPCITFEYPDKQPMAITPMRTDRQFVYIEYTILEGDDFELYVGLGINHKRFNDLPELEKGSYSYSNSGLKFTGSLASQEQYGPKYGKGDVIGVIWNRRCRTCSFTRNGVHLGVACRDVPSDDLSAMIGLYDGYAKVQANFGTEPYVYNMDDLLIDEENRHNPGVREPWKFKEKVYPIHMAACAENTEALKLYLDHGAVVNQKDQDKWTAIHFAAWKGQHEGVQLLLANGADPNAQTEHGSTPILLAVKFSHTQVTKVLLDAKAELDVRDHKKRTLLMIAAHKGNLEVVNMLLDKNVDIKAKDSDGKTAMQYASNEGVVTALEAAFHNMVTYRNVYEINKQVEARQGENGQVVMAKVAATCELVAIKYHFEKEARDRSVEILSKLHKNYAATLANVEPKDAIFDDMERKGAHYALVCNGGDKSLQEVLDEYGDNTLPDNECRYTFECMAFAVWHLHTQDLVHHDLKPKNFVRFFDGRYRLVDFDSCRSAGNQDIGKTTPHICPPEVAHALRKKDKLPSRKSMDIWSLGCCLYQMVTRCTLLAALCPNKSKQDTQNFTEEECWKVWSDLTQDDVKNVINKLAESPKSSRMSQHAASLLHGMLKGASNHVMVFGIGFDFKVDPIARVEIKDVLLHSFLQGGNTSPMDEEVLRNIQETVTKTHANVAAIRTHVVAIHERTITLENLPNLKDALDNVILKISGLNKLVMQIATKSECPTMFVITPDVSVKDVAAISGNPNAANSAKTILMDWADRLKEVFSSKELTLTDLMTKMTYKTYRLHLVCEHCMKPVGDGYPVEKTEDWVVKLLPALKVSFNVAKAYNLAAGLGRFVFPALPVIPADLMEKGNKLLETLEPGKTSADDFACIKAGMDSTVKDMRPQEQAGAALRQLHEFLKQADKSCTWGGLALVNEGDTVMWVCRQCIASGGVHADTTNSVSKAEYESLQKRCKELEEQLATANSQPAAVTATVHINANTTSAGPDTPDKSDGKQDKTQDDTLDDKPDDKPDDKQDIKQDNTQDNTQDTKQDDKPDDKQDNSQDNNQEVTQDDKPDDKQDIKQDNTQDNNQDNKQDDKQDDRQDNTQDSNRAGKQNDNRAGQQGSKQDGNEFSVGCFGRKRGPTTHKLFVFC